MPLPAEPEGILYCVVIFGCVHVDVDSPFIQDVALT